MRLAVLSLLALFASIEVGAVTFRASIDESRWEMESSRFSCRLRQEVPAYGIATFEHPAGEAVRFALTPIQKEQVVGRATLIAEASDWQPGIEPQVLGQVEPAESGLIEVAPELAQNMLAALFRGMTPTFNTENWYGTPDTLKVGISAANFQSAYTDYLNCVAGLLPVNFRQIARTAILFPSGASELSPATRERLDLIALYVSADDSIQSIYVDGHSDNLGRRLLNRDLSKRRAEVVTRYLVQLGVPEDKIVTRYHGERYPVVPNTSAENRARNRRVTVRLEREGGTAR
ncbi:MAG: OmpA family protein [Oceanospirillaceae bacterium]|jgi:outer membrane protein OmpA-like peptidoglycan-associated protein|uniref:flagellar protein MotY n=1 Tax=Marinobacterium litorale TaxID=404770 RepID=UPI00040F8292|nr:OmpA family protein [Marinobacterium litorale]MBT00344.1 OmpA family protein [Oceanospirillaceae bacterium]